MYPIPYHTATSKVDDYVEAHVKFKRGLVLVCYWIREANDSLVGG